MVVGLTMGAALTPTPVAMVEVGYLGGYPDLSFKSRKPMDGRWSLWIG